MPSFRRIVAAAAVAGLACGVLLTLLQHVEIVPLIRQAEAFEAGGHDELPTLLSTLAANVLVATGFALLLAAAIAFKPGSGWRRGLAWGVAGFVAFFVAPSIGLPPELPGAEHAPLTNRQLWWVGTALFTAAGLWLAVFVGHAAARVAGLALIVAPHLLGAPGHTLHGGGVPAELAREFVRATYLVNALFWLALGALVGRLSTR